LTDFGTPSLLELLTSQDAASLSALCRRRHYRDGEVVHERGDTDLRMGIVIKGCIKLLRLNRNGEIAFALTVRAGQNYGDTVALDRFERTHRAIAIGETEVDFLSADGLHQILEREPAIVTALYRVAAHRLIVAVDLIDDMRMLKIEARLAKYLLTLLDLSNHPPRVDCLQEDLAQFLGVSSVTVVKGLRILERSGLIKTRYRHIIVPDSLRLQEWLESQD
jgi:CRP/FNR family transcriptional regulator, cyclic AMP receptor protein